MKDSLKSTFPSFEGKNIIFNLLKAGTQSISSSPLLTVHLCSSSSQPSHTSNCSILLGHTVYNVKIPSHPRHMPGYVGRGATKTPGWYPWIANSGASSGRSFTTHGRANRGRRCRHSSSSSAAGASVASVEAKRRRALLVVCPRGEGFNREFSQESSHPLNKAHV